MKKFNHFSVILLIFFLLVSGCKKEEEIVYTPSGSDMQALKKQYNLAVLDAKVAEPWEIYRSLISVVNYGDSMAGQGNLVWSLDSLGKIRVLVVSWMKGTTTQYLPVGTTFKTNSNQAYMSWITTDPEMLDFLKKNSYTDSSKLHLRIAQVLGMPPDTKNNFFVEFWVYPENLFRPSPDCVLHHPSVFVKQNSITLLQ